MTILEYVWLSPLLPLLFGALASATTWITATLAWSWRLNLDSQMQGPNMQLDNSASEGIYAIHQRKHCDTGVTACACIRVYM